MQVHNSQAELSTISGVVGALENLNILVPSPLIITWQVIDDSQIPNFETPYSMFPNTYQSITIHEDQSIRAIITERQKQLHAVLDEISALEDLSDIPTDLHHQLVDKKDKITQSLNLHKGLLSALWRLPTEVLSQIFCHCLEFDDLSPPSKLKAPMLLTRICRPWREVAVDMPSLWCRMYVRAAPGDWKRQAFCYDSWLKRSRGHPLSLALRCPYSWARLGSLLQPYITQILSLSVEFVYLDYITPELILTDFLALEKLIISVRGVSDATSDDPMTAITYSTPQLPPTLRHLVVTGWLFDREDLHSFGRTWPHLTDITINIYHLTAVHYLLHEAPNLSSLKILLTFGPRASEALELFTHDKLQSLHIACSDDPTTQLSELFDALSLPNLRILEVRGVQMWPHEEFKALVARSNCPLESLIVCDGVEMTDSQRAEYVVLIPSLQFPVPRPW